MRWEELPAVGDVPEARSSHTIHVIGDTVYLLGGEHTPRVPLGSDVFTYSLSDKRWRKVEVSGTPPPVRNAHAGATVGTDIYIFGGRCGIAIGEAALDDLHRFDTTTATWHAVEPAGGVRPPKRSYAAATCARGRFYVFGGCGAEGCGRLNDMWEFDPATAAWRQLPTSGAIRGRGGPGFVATADALFVVAGFAGEETNDVHRFDLDSETWDCACCTKDASPAAGSCSHDNPVVALPPRSVCAVATHAGCASACAHGGHIVVFGGEVDPAAEGHAGVGCYSADTFCMDPACRHFHRLAPGGEPPQPRGWLAAAACPAGLVVHGGNSLSNERLGDMFLLHLH